MTADTFITPNERALSGALALVTHALFFALLVFGVSWQKREQAAMVAELWTSLPPMSAPQPEPEVKPQPEPPPPPPKAEAKPVPKAEPVPAPKADIALKDKKDKQRKAQELAEKKKQQEQARVAEQARAAEAQRLAREQDEALKKIAAQQASERAKMVDEYKRRIAERVKRYIIEPPNLQGNPEVELDIVVLPGGEVLDVRTRKASAATAWDNAVERAIRRAQPLPLPPDPALAKEFRELNLKFRPKE
ncbi:MAG: cell envelope integrity protein TolA [Betaproteobacteria bacterium]|nr:cell envelope integrity protein TolA [Betaproteobacteria bacterium]